MSTSNVRLTRYIQELQRQLNNHRRHAAEVSDRREVDTKAVNEATASHVTQTVREFRKSLLALKREYDQLKKDYDTLSSSSSNIHSSIPY